MATVKVPSDMKKEIVVGIRGRRPLENLLGHTLYILGK